MFKNLVQTGKARFEYRHFPWHGVPSDRVAVAMECGADQSGTAFWQLHDRFMKNASARNTRQGVLNSAESIGLDMEQFTECLDDPERLDQIEAGQQAARALGVSRTPRIHVNGSNAGITLISITRAVKAASP